MFSGHARVLARGPSRPSCDPPARRRYVFSPGEVGATEAVLLAHYGQTKVLAVDYRMPPDHPFPAAPDDALAVYQAVIKQHRPADVAVFGTSAGGGLAAAMLQQARAKEAAMPAVLGLGTPWADLTKTGDTMFTNEDIDQVLVHYNGVLGAAARLYAGDHDLADPRLSPVNGDFAGFPPTILIGGTRDMLLSAIGARASQAARGRNRRPTARFRGDAARLLSGAARRP